MLFLGYTSFAGFEVWEDCEYSEYLEWKNLESGRRRWARKALNCQNIKKKKKNT